MEAKNDPIITTSSPLLVTYVSEHQKNEEKLANFHNKMDVCSTTFIDIVDGIETEIFSVPVYCNNRGCLKKGCQKHRGYLFSKEHKAQQEYVTKSMNHPKGWIFTGWVLNTWDPVELKRFARKKFLKLYHILKETKFGSATEFSIHMELKFNEDGTVYLHFHVVMGGIKCSIKTMRSLWGRVVKYECAIKPERVSEYVSKYASKTPNFQNSTFNQDWYHLVVYKMQMHRFSVSKNEAELSSDIIKTESGYYPYSLLLAEAKSAYMKDSYLNPKSKENYYHPLLEPPLESSRKNHCLFSER